MTVLSASALCGVIMATGAVVFLRNDMPPGRYVTVGELIGAVILVGLVGGCMAFALINGAARVLSSL